MVTFNASPCGVMILYKLYKQGKKKITYLNLRKVTGSLRVKSHNTLNRKEVYKMYVHTFEVSCMLTSERYFKIQEVIKALGNKWNGSKKDKMEYYELSDKGILITFVRVCKKNFTSYSVKYRISAQRVMDNNNYTGLFNTKNYNKLEKKVNRILTKTCEHLPLLEECSLRRIDYCINGRLESQKQVKEYIKLCQRCNIPNSLKKYRYKNKSKAKYNNNDMTVVSSEYIEVSLYNKYAQMKEQEKDFPDIKDAKNIVRIEIRCMKDKLEQIRKRKKFEALKLDDKVKGYMKHSDAIAEYLYHYYLEKMFGKGAFYTLPEARERIENSGFSKVNKNNMTEFIEYANTARSFNDAVCFYIECCGKSYVKNLLYFFDLIDTSPVTVTRDIAKSFDGQYIPHPIDLLDDFNN